MLERGRRGRSRRTRGRQTRPCFGGKLGADVAMLAGVILASLAVVNHRFAARVEWDDTPRVSIVEVDEVRVQP